MHAKLKRIRSFTIMILLYLILGSSGIEQQSPDMMDFEQAREEISAEARRERNKPLVVSAPPGQSEVPRSSHEPRGPSLSAHRIDSATRFGNKVGHDNDGTQ